MSADIEAVYLAVEPSFGPGDDFKIDDVVYFAQREAEKRARELGSMWGVQKLYVEGDTAQHVGWTS